MSVRSSSPFSGITLSSSPPIPIPTTKSQKQKPVADLAFALEILSITTRNCHKELCDSLEKLISSIDSTFHELEQDEISPIVERIIRVFNDTTKTKSKYVKRDEKLTRPIYFDQHEKAAYVYLRKGSKFIGNPKFLKVNWNDKEPTVEKSFTIPALEDG